MTARTWTYPVELTDALLRFGLAPRPDTPPRFVRDQLSDLYRYEIRRLRGRLLADEFPKRDYIGHVITLRKKYWPLALTPEQWEKVCSESEPSDHRTFGPSGPSGPSDPRTFGPSDDEEDV